MPWQQINPRYVRQDHPDLRAAWYRDTSARGGGELMLWLDRHDRVVAFQLSHEEWPSLRHYVAEWQSGSATRIGHVEEDEPSHRPRLRPAPIMRFNHRPDPDAADRLLHYFRDNAAPVPSGPRRHIASVLAEAAA